MFIGRQQTGSECVLFNGSQPAWMEQPKQGLAYRRMEETAFCSTGHGRNSILFIERGLAYRKMEETDLCWSAYGRNGVLFIGNGVAYRKMGLHELLFMHLSLPLTPASTGYCSSTVDFL